MLVFLTKFFMLVMYVAVFVLLNKLDNATVELIFRFWLAVQITTMGMTFITYKPNKKGEKDEHN